LARELIDVENVDILVGTVSSGATASLQEVAAENQVPLIVAPAAANDITGINFNEYTFRTSRSNYQDAINLCEYLVTQYDTFVQISPDYAFGYGGAAAFRDACSFFGGQFPIEDIFAPLDTQDFTPYIEQMQDSGADAWIANWAGAGFIPLIQAATELGMTEEMGMASAIANNETVPVFYGSLLGQNGGILYHYTLPDNPINDFLVEKITAETGGPPDLFDADGMNAGIMAIEAIKKTGGDASSSALIAAMEGLEFEGPKGTVLIRPEDHVAIQDMYIVTILNIDDPNFDFFELVNTTRPNPPCLLPDALQDRCGDLAVGKMSAELLAPPTVTLSCDEPVKVGFITDLSGPLAVYGSMAERGFMAGLEYAAGGPATGENTYVVDDCEIQVLIRDDQSAAETTATLARELIDVEDVDFLVGTVSSGATASLQEVAAENQVPLIVAPAAANDITGVNFNEYTFRTSRENYQDAINLCEYLVTQYDTFVQISPDYAFGYGGAAAFRDACSFFGGQFPIEDIFAPLDTQDFTPYIEQMQDSGAEAWIANWAGAGFIPLITAANELGMTEEMGMASAIANNETVPVFYGSLVGQNGGILYHYSLPDNPINDFLVEKITADSGGPPDLFDADGMNAALLLVEGIRASGGDSSSAALIAAMEGLEFEGPKGTVYIRPEDHVAIQDMYIVKILNIDDPDFDFFELVETTRPEPPCLLPEALQDRCGELIVGSLTGE
jgi:branched-chain amino acid transport system substrate-binding protein